LQEKTPFQNTFQNKHWCENARKNPFFKSNIKATLFVQNKSKPIKNMRKTKGNNNFIFPPLAITSIFYNTHLPELYLLPNKYKHTGHTSEYTNRKIIYHFIP